MTMALPVGLDLDLLRSFVIIAEEKSFTRAADRVGRTQSAVSLQMQRLEGVLGQTILTRGKGGQVEVNQLGQMLLGRARDLLALNDDLLNSLRAVPVHGTVKFGLPEELSARYLSRILERFAEVAPAVVVQVVSAASCALAAQLKNDQLDLVILESSIEPRQWPATKIWEGPLVWVTSTAKRQHLRDPLPVSFSPPHCPWRPPWLTECVWRGMAQRALEQAGRKYHTVSTSGTTAGQLAAVSAGLAVTCTLFIDRLPEGVRTVRPDEGLPPLPDTSFLLLKSRTPSQPLTDMLAAQIFEIFEIG
jgi:DNA-binding transcriptional LysR family regulator